MGHVFLLKFLKFSVVGASGVVVDFGVTYLLKELLRANKYLANSLGFICAASSNYLLNRLWTFGSTDPNIGRQYVSFILIALVGLAINNFIIWLLNDRMKVDFSRLFPHRRNIKSYDTERDEERGAKLNFYASKLVSIAVVTVWNFLMNYFFTF